MDYEIEKLQSILKQDPSNFQIRRELSILLSNRGFNEEALSNIKYLVKYFPEDDELHYNLGILYEKIKDLKKAKLSYQKAIKISPQDDYYYNLGEVLVSLQEWDLAIDAFNNVLKNDKNDGNCYFNLGLCYYHKDETNLAIDHFQKAITLNPKDIFAHFYLGNIYQNNRLTNFAVECYKNVLDISPDYSWAYYNLASIAYENENIEEALDYLLKTIEYNKNDIEAYKLLTKIYIKENNAEEVINLLESRLNNDENGDLYYILAQAYKHIGEQDNYINNLKCAIKSKLTLTYPLQIVKRELEIYETQSELEVQEVPDYTSDDDKISDEEFENDEYTADYYDDEEEVENKDIFDNDIEEDINIEDYDEDFDEYDDNEG
jgi:tetratricopeptide (TPR) repeat protein